MKKTFGVLAHVDSGKTTFSENLLYHMGIVRFPGRVDAGTTLLDTDEVEKARGITIYAGQSQFEYQGDTYCLLDTPGHVDFSPETERAVTVLDYAIALIDASKGVAAHTITLFRLLERYRVPVFFFLNKMDLETADEVRVMGEIREKLTKDAYLIGEEDGETLGEGKGRLSEELVEFAAERDDDLAERYLNGDEIDASELSGVLTRLIEGRRAFLCFRGSAAKDQGIQEFFRAFHCLTRTNYQENGSFTGRVYKIRHDGKGQRVTFLKVLRGTLSAREELFSRKGTAGKVNEIRIYSGEKSQSSETVSAGLLCGVTGLSDVSCGSLLESDGSGADEEEKKLSFRMIPAFQAKVVSEETDSHKLLKVLKILEEEEPQLAAEHREDGSILVSVMGNIELEVLKQVLEERFGIQAEFSRPQVLYKETIGKPVMGFGHYEPLRHYAEVHLRLEPAPRGSGITFDSECHVDTLGENYQNLVKTHVFERVHKGILTGSPLTDVRIVLTSGRAHLKHTEGGDFRQAVYRAIRQGLEKANNILLEPYCSLEIAAEEEYAGKIMADIQKRSGSFEPPERLGKTVRIRGAGPACEFMDYGMELAALTRGGGSVSMVTEGYRPCHNSDEVIKERAYDKGADKENPSSSVFCSHGAGFVVNWDKVEEYIHLPREVIREKPDGES